MLTSGFHQTVKAEFLYKGHQLFSDEEIISLVPQESEHVLQGSYGTNDDESRKVVSHSDPTSAFELAACCMKQHDDSTPTDMFLKSRHRKSTSGRFTIPSVGKAGQLFFFF